MPTITLSDKQYEDYLQYLTYPVGIQDVPKPTKSEFGDFNTHPTIKPVKLMRWLVKLLSSEGDTVLDLFAGSGTTGVACVELNRKFIGIEMNQEYMNIAKQRTNNSPLCSWMLGDCIEQMKEIPDNSITTVITDPPYAIKIAHWDDFETNQHFHDFTKEWAKECYRVLKPGGTIASFNAARTYHLMAYGIDEAGFICRDMVEWVYWSGMPKGRNLKGCHEPIYIGAKLPKGTPVGAMTYNLDDVRIPVKEGKEKKGKKKVTINKLEMEVEKTVDVVQMV